MITVEIWQTEAEFARFEKKIQRVRDWLDNWPKTHRWIAIEMTAAGIKLRLRVERKQPDADGT